MKEKNITIIMVVLVGISLLGILLWMIPAIKLGLSSVPEDEKLLATSVSPNNAYKLQAYRTEPGATVDFSVKVYIVTKKEKIKENILPHDFYDKIRWSK